MREVRGRLVLGVLVFSLPFLPCFLPFLSFLSDEAGAGAGAGGG